MSTTEDIAISIKNVSKNFLLPHEKNNSIKNIFIHPFSVFRSSKNAEVQHALKDISFDIKRGEFFGIVGRNGSGKSTLLKIIAEIYQPTSGTVGLSGRLVPFIELGVGFNPELTGKENVYLSGALNGFSTTEMDEMYDDVVKFAELEQFMDQKLKNYSSGMQVRLAFSVATRAKADILLIDEVLAVGDADFQRKCFNYFKELKKSNITVIFVSHDMDAVREYCDRAAFIDKSKMVAIGNTDTIAQSYTKLFMENVDADTPSKKAVDDRWGSGGIKTRVVSVALNEHTISVRQTIKATKSIDGFVAGFRIRSTSGASITGTNSKIEKLKLDNIMVGEELTIQWSLPNILSDGLYYVDAAVNGLDGVEVYDWWDEAASVLIKKSRTVPYLVDPTFKVTFIKD